MLGPKLRELRLAKRLTLREVADQLGTSATFVHHLECDVTRPSEERLTQLAKVLDADFDELNLLTDRIPADVLGKLKERPELLNRLRTL